MSFTVCQFTKDFTDHVAARYFSLQIANKIIIPKLSKHIFLLS